MDIKKERIKKGISQIRLSYACGVSRFRLQAHESGYKELPKEDLKKAINYLTNQKPVSNWRVRE